jgi:hypothetical protein
MFRGRHLQNIEPLPFVTSGETWPVLAKLLWRYCRVRIAIAAIFDDRIIGAAVLAKWSTVGPKIASRAYVISAERR